MKKLFMSLLLCSLAGAIACSKNTKEIPDNEPSIDSRKIAVPRDTEESETLPNVEENNDRASCDPKGGEGQCFLMPAAEDDCWGCIQGNPQEVVNKKTRDSEMPKKAKMCKAKVEAFMKKNQGKKPDIKNADASCKFNAATCSPQGQCVGVSLSQEELQKRFGGQQGGRGPQGRGPQGPQRGGDF